jgi:hypothetical protein
MFESHGSPNKGRPMYSRTEVRDSMQSLGQSSATGAPIDLNATAPAVLARPAGNETERTEGTASHTPVPNWQRTMSEDVRRFAVLILIIVCLSRHSHDPRYWSVNYIIHLTHLHR